MNGHFLRLQYDRTIMDRREFEQSAAQVREKVLGVARRMLVDDDEAEDVAQDTLLRLWDSRARLSSPASMRALGMVIARNRCIDLLRGKGRTRIAALDEVDVASAALSPEEAMISTEGESQAAGMLAMLPDVQRRVLTLKHVDGLEVDEIAAITGATPNAVRVNLSRARNRIKQIYESHR